MLSLLFLFRVLAFSASRSHIPTFPSSPLQRHFWQARGTASATLNFSAPSVWGLFCCMALGGDAVRTLVCSWTSTLLETFFLACTNMFQPPQNMVYVLLSPVISVPSWYRNWPTPLRGLDKWLSLDQQSSAGEACSCLGSFAFSRRANGNLRTELPPGELSAGVCGKASIVCPLQLPC